MTTPPDFLLAQMVRRARVLFEKLQLVLLRLRTAFVSSISIASTHRIVLIGFLRSGKRFFSRETHIIQTVDKKFPN
jgi:hypothetical protein